MPKDQLSRNNLVKALKRSEKTQLETPSIGNARKKALMFVEKRIKSFCLIDQWVKLT